jgi:hypothetical protein
MCVCMCVCPVRACVYNYVLSNVYRQEDPTEDFDDDDDDDAPTKITPAKKRKHASKIASAASTVKDRRYAEVFFLLMFTLCSHYVSIH